MLEEQKSKMSFGNIALCLSGGGYRAASFHLGMLSMLDELKLLDNVKYFSTASGGTIVAMKFVIDKIAKKDFSTFAEEFRSFLLSCNVVDEAFRRLCTTPSPAGANDLSLIRSAASVYRAKLVGDLTLKHLSDDMDINKTFSDLIFNATEFRGGGGFRFRAAADLRFVVGNRDVSVTDGLRGDISLADIVAASSCFPGAFEPIRFPDDFVFSDRTLARTPFEGKGSEIASVAIMDGGIFDNQGLHGMMVSYTTDPLPFDFVIVSDTTQKGDEFLKYEAGKRRKGVSLKFFLIFFSISLAVLLTGSVVLAINVLRDLTSVSVFQSILLTLVAVFSFFVSASLFGLIGFGLYKISNLEVSGFSFPIWSYVKNLNYSDIKSLVLRRFFSAKAMTFNIFMKRIRALTMDAALGANDSKTKDNLLYGKIIFSLIYDLDLASNHPGLFSHDDEIKPTLKMSEISERAGKTATTLWINDDAFEDLVACGRFTTCFSLLELIWTRWQKAENEAVEKLLPSIPKPTEPKSPFFNDYSEIKAKWNDLEKEFADPVPQKEAFVAV
jgi:predicted acylesterase/phospholipase RssA